MIRKPGPAIPRGLLWCAIAAALAARRGATRRAALRGMLAIVGANAATHTVPPPLLPQRRSRSGSPARSRGTLSPSASGPAASAAAFTTAVSLESPRAGLVIAPLAAAAAYCRTPTSAHSMSDALVGVVIGSAIALCTQRWWPVRTTDEARARPRDDAPVLKAGAGLVMVVNQRSGAPEHDPLAEISAALPGATVLPTADGVDLREQLENAVEARDGHTVSAARAIGVAGGDGTVAAAASVAGERNLPLVVVPAGTLNHFARDIGVYDLQEAVDAAQAGEAVAVDLGVVEIHHSDQPARRRYFLNTASLGCYSDLVRLREKWQPRWGKWPAFAAALVTSLHNAQPMRVKLDGHEHQLWILFVGNGPYHPRGMVPAWRPQLDSGLLDIRYLRADRRLSRTRAVIALLLGALRHTRTYVQREAPSLDVELIGGPAWLATDGEVLARVRRLTFRVAERPIAVYRRIEVNWPDRPRPHLRW
ncbi:MAG: diacylglycerol/lipid kinase family protein [Pseudonocardiaceae bacterium]